MLTFEEFKKSHSLKPNYYDLINIGNSYLQLGQYDKAIQFYNEATRYQPMNPETYLLLGNTYSLVDTKTAKTYFQFAYEIAKYYNEQ
jgi:tetratricopeptide (TPR) repeat protein